MSNILYEFLNAYWLRPESAMWRTVDVESMKNFQMRSPSLDLGCGDGTFSFLRAGGSFDESYDVFTVGNLDSFFENIDVYDYYDSRKINIKREARYKIDVGLDHKETLQAKASKLNLYKEFVTADANKGLPFESNSFLSVFSNIIYWLDDPVYVFSEIYRVLKPGGQCCVMLPSTQYLESSFFYKYCIEQKREELDFLKLIDRGRVSENLKIVKDQREWEAIICDAGFEIKECVPHLSKTLIQIWDIGLRPLFPFLMKMVNEIDKDKMIEIKKEWVSFFSQIITPIISNENKLTQNQEYCFFCYILEKGC